MAELPVTVPGLTTDIEHIYIFDHMGREINVRGYEGGMQFLNSDTLSIGSLRMLADDAQLDEDSAPVPHVAGGAFGQRTHRDERRDDYGA